MTHTKQKYFIVLIILLSIILVQICTVYIQYSHTTAVLTLLESQTNINTQLVDGIFELQGALNGSEFEPADGWQTK